MDAVLKTAALNALSIQPASVDDTLLIRTLAERIWPVCFAGIIKPDQIANMLEVIYSVENLTTQMQEGQHFWIARTQNEAVGYASAYKEEDTIWLKKLYVDPAQQGRGIGTHLLNHAISAFLPANDIRLLVNRDNVAAQKFYTRSGFARIAEKPVMMGDFPFIDYIYSKAIKHE